jgi:hypothetical protein
MLKLLWVETVLLHLSYFSCGPIFVLECPIAMGRSSCCVVSVCGPVSVVMYPTMMGRSSSCVVCVW